MKLPPSFPRLKGFRYPREIFAYAVSVYHRFALSTADVEDLLAERGVVVSRETIRLWVNRFGAHFAGCIRRDRPKPNDTWHLDEVVIDLPAPPLSPLRQLIPPRTSRRLRSVERLLL
jgi:putative transposase